MLACGLLAAALASFGIARAHHSQGMFGVTPYWVRGSIVRYVPVDPHVMIELEERRADGRTRRWIVEGPRMGRLDRILELQGEGEPRRFLKVGDVISVCGFPLKPEFAPERMYADWQPAEGRFVHGQLIVTPDGRMRSWGPYGKLDNCIREGDSVETWVALLDADPLAHKQWCDSQTSVRTVDLAPPQLVARIDHGLARRCR